MATDLAEQPTRRMRPLSHGPWKRLKKTILAAVQELAPEFVEVLKLLAQPKTNQDSSSPSSNQEQQPAAADSQSSLPENESFGDAARRLAAESFTKTDSAVEFADQVGQRLVPFLMTLMTRVEDVQDKVLELATPAVDDDTSIEEIGRLLQEGAAIVTEAMAVEAGFIKAIVSNFNGATMAASKRGSSPAVSGLS